MAKCIILESELHLDLALEKQERLSKELSVKMENKKLFDETEFALVYLQDFVHTDQDSYNSVQQMVSQSGVSIMEVKTNQIHKSCLFIFHIYSRFVRPS